MVNSSAKLTRLEEMNRVKVGYVDASAVGGRTVVRILLDVKPKEAHVGSVLLLKGKDGSRSVGEVVLHQTIVNELLPHFWFHLHLFLSNIDYPHMDFSLHFAHLSF